MKIALWIIAVVETIRMIEQSIQLRLIANDKSKMNNVYDELIKSFKASDREYVRNLLEAFDKQDEPQTGQPCDGCEYSKPYIEYKCTHHSCKFEDEPQTDCAWSKCE